MDKFTELKKEVDKVYHEEQKIEFSEKEILKKEDILLSLSNLKFSNIMDWHKMCWMGCHEKIPKHENKLIIYYCKLLNNYCRFEDCPKNKRQK